MNSKEITVSTIVLVVLLLFFFLIIRNAGKTSDENGGSEKSSADSASPLEGLSLNTDSSGFEKQQELAGRPSNDQEKQPSVQPQKKSPPVTMLKDGVDYQAVIKTSLGDMTVDLYEKLTPIAVNSFVFLSKSGFYDGLIFHRVIKDFMIQGGDPNGNGTGGPNYSFEDEIDKTRHLVKGSLAMANAGPNTNGSQFFIVTRKNTPWLDKLHTNFGMVIDGIEVAEKIELVKTGPKDKPLQDVVIKTIEIIEK